MRIASALFLVTVAFPVFLVVAHAGFSAVDWLRGAK